MNWTYDDEADALYVYAAGPIEPGAAIKQEQVAERVFLDWDAAGRFLGVEILGSSTTLVAESPDDRAHRIRKGGRRLGSSGTSAAPVDDQ